MASQVPTGYNPETSLLSGGTAPILPVQGGGSMEAGGVPAGYNPDQSLLNTGHNAPIVPIRGGGGEGEKPYQDYVLEQYDPPLKPIKVPILPDNRIRRDVISEYTKKSKSELMEVRRYDREPEPFTERDEVAPTYEKCSTQGGQRRLPLNFFELVRKRIVFIDESDPIIWIIPNLKGDISKFLQFMNIIPKGADGNIDPKHFVFFTGSFFSLTSIKDNMILYHEFLVLKNKNMKNLFYLNHLNDDFINVSCSIYSSLYSTETLKTPEQKKKPLTTFFEPDIVFFRKPHIILKNSEPPVQREDPRVKASALLTLPEFTTKSFLLVPSRNAFDQFPDDDSNAPEEQRWFSLAFNRSVIKQIKKPKTSEIQCPEGSSCNGFMGGYKLVDVGDDRKIEEPGLYLLYINKDKMPFLKEAGAKLSPEELGEVTVVEPEEKEVDVVEIEPEASVVLPPKPKKKSLVLPGIDVVKPPPEEPFKPDPSAASATNERTIEINTVEYRIRIPFEKAVKEDWLKGKFNESEVEFLQSLQFTPKLLSDTFGTGEWKARLAEFLEKIVLSDCFQDTTLLTHIECSNAQQFVRKVYLQLYNRALQDVYSEMGVPKPESFDTLLAQMKALQGMGPLAGTTFINKNDYTGDLLERFQVIYYNKEKGEYFTDFTQMTDATREILKKMKLYRVEDMDIEEITRAILERLKIPVPPKPGNDNSNSDSISPDTPPAPPPPPPPSPLLKASKEEQCKVVYLYLESKPDVITYDDTKIQKFVSTTEAREKGITPAIFKDCIREANKVLQGELYRLESDITGIKVPANEYTITDVAGDGWCFYYSLLQSVGAGTDYPVLKDGQIKTVAPIQSTVKAFIQAIQTNINSSPDKNIWKERYELAYGVGTYDTYVKNLANEKAKNWADPEYGVGQAAADVLKATIEVYRSVGTNFNLVQTYEPSIITDPSRILRVNFAGLNHYQILTKRKQASSASGAGAGPVLPAQQGPTGNRYPKTLPGPDPTYEECVALKQAFMSYPHYLPPTTVTEGGKEKIVRRLNEHNAYRFREETRDRAKHPDYSIYFIAKCWDMDTALFPPDEYGFQFLPGTNSEWVNRYFSFPRKGEPTTQECKLIEITLKGMYGISDKKNLTAIDLDPISAKSYDFSYPFMKTCLAKSTEFRIEPKFAATIPDFDPSQSQGGGGEDEVFAVGGAVKATYRKQTKRAKKDSSHPSRRHGRHNRTHKQKRV